MTLLRLLTNRTIMGQDLLSPGQAISAYVRLLNDVRVRFAEETPGIEDEWLSLMAIPEAAGSAWTDAWLVAFSMVHGFRLISFDAALRRRAPGVVKVPRR
jgi:hypothetical protein